MAERTNDWEGGAPDTPRAGTYGAARAASDDPTDATQDPAAIRADIRDTRERLGDTLEEIGERLNPHNITAQVKDNIRDATIGRVEHMARNAADRVSETRSTIMDTIRENPIPAAMVGIGLGWLLLNRSQRTSVDAGTAYSRSVYGGSPYTGSAYGSGAYEGAYGGASGGYPGAPYGSAEYGGSEEEHGTMQRARERAGEMGHQVQHTAGELAGRAQGAARQVADRAQNVASTVADRTRTGARRTEQWYYEQPLAAGAATLALGLAAGLVLPATDREVQLMGDARDRVVDRVREAAHEAREKVETVVERVVDEAQTAGKEAAREQGLTSSGA